MINQRIKIVKVISILLCLIVLVSNQVIHIKSPASLVKQLDNKPIKMHLSPLGFRHLSGQLYTVLRLADPITGCKNVSKIKKSQNQESVFILVNDKECLESVKGKKVHQAGGDGAIIKKNTNNSLIDRENNIVNIPILQIQPEQFQIILKALSMNETVSAMIDFQTNNLAPSVIQLQIFFSPTEKQSFSFLSDLHSFIKGQPVYFTPHYAMHSQNGYWAQKQYTGCYSSGRYCAAQIQYEGRKQGENVMGEILREVVIWKQYGGPEGKWWDYVKLYKKMCLDINENIMMKTNTAKICSEKVMLMVGINSIVIDTQVNNSFEGQNPLISNNLYLMEERQQFVLEQIDKYPLVLINKKQYPLDLQKIKDRICLLQENGKINTQCSEILYGKGTDSGNIMIGIGILLIGMVCLTILYKFYIKRQMQNQIKDEVSQTLKKYYQYMENYQNKSIDQNFLKEEQNDPKIVEEEMIERKKHQTKFRQTELKYMMKREKIQENKRNQISKLTQNKQKY